MGLLLAFSIVLGMMFFVPIILETKKPGDPAAWFVMPVWAKAVVVSWVVCTVTFAIGVLFF